MRNSKNESTRLEAILGQAGVGKSYTINQRIKANPKYGIRTATTGIAAVNMDNIEGVADAITINKALTFFDAASILKAYCKGILKFRIKMLCYSYRNLIIDECFMMNAAILDIIVMAIRDYNREYYADFGLILLGDVGQLTPVQGAPIFEAECWKDFKITKLEEVKRQENKEFAEALNHLRVGNLELALPYLEKNANFTSSINKKFKGTTFFPTNAEVTSFNRMRLQKILTPFKVYKAKITGSPDSLWNQLPQTIMLKQGCLIQLLYNDPEGKFANGDIAIVEEVWDNCIFISLLRRNKSFYLKPRKIFNYHVNSLGFKNKKPIGTLELMHVRLAYALTIHKVQSLTLDNVQICLNGPGKKFLGSQSGMLYTALSRVKTVEGLNIVGTIKDLRESCYVNPDYLKWM